MSGAGLPIALLALVILYEIVKELQYRDRRE